MNKTKIKLYASMNLTLEQVMQGFKTNGVSQNVEVVLCQTAPFFVSHNQRWLEVLFEKDIDEIYVDIDDFNYDYKCKELDDDKEYLTIPWSQLNINPDDEELGQYSTFVYDVKPHEIIQVSEVQSDDMNECHRKLVYKRP